MAVVSSIPHLGESKIDVAGMLRPCSVPGCETLTLGGGRCLAHELREEAPRAFVRGRPFVAAAKR